jgi:hypothetical protein
LRHRLLAELRRHAAVGDRRPPLGKSRA